MKKRAQKEQEQQEGQAVPIAIVGIGCLFPKANDVASYWSNIKEGVDAITEVPPSHWDPNDYFDGDQNAPDMTYARRGGFIDSYDFDPLLYGLSPNNIEATDTTQLLGMAVARQALLDAGYATAKGAGDGREFDRDRTCVILGVTGTLELVIPLGARLGHPIWRKALRDAGVDEATAEDVVARIAEGYVPWQENSFPGLLGNVAAGRVANRFDLGGTNCVVDAACASSLSAIHMAAMELYAGRADMAITGGYDTFNDIFMYMCFSKTPALSPTGDSRPFDHKGDGTILGEGLGAIILKRLPDAKRDGDKIYAVIRGLGSSSDGRGNAIYAPSPEGQQKALRSAYQQAGVAPRTIELVEAHGTGTKVGDAVEAQALSAVYREDQPEGTWCAIGSIKSMIGHTKAAAGVAGIIKVAMALQHKVLPPTIKVEQPLDILEPGKAPVYVNTEKRPWVRNAAHPRRGALSAFGFGGSNFHCVLEEVDEENPEIEWDGNVLLFAFSGDSPAALLTAIDKLDAQHPWQALRGQAARSLQVYDASLKCRLLLVVDRNNNQLEKLIENVKAQLIKQPVDKAWHLPNGAFYGEGDKPGQLAMLFPGQGSQYTGMLRDLACQFPQLLDTLQRANVVTDREEHGERLSDYIYPIPVFTKAAKQTQEEILRRTDNAQPAIGAVSIGALRVLELFGVKADAVAGHSFGELSALCAGGVMAEADLYKTARRRGELMQQGEGDHGGMLAVFTAVAEVHKLLEEEQLDLVIANNNSPNQVILSGASDQIERALALMQVRNITARKLPVAAAFHSSFVADAEKPFIKFLQGVEFHQGRIPVYANTTADIYPSDPDKARDLLAGQLAQPVEFVEEISNLYEAGIRTFIEVGPGNVLSGLVDAILAEAPHQALAVDASKGKRSGQFDLACLLAQLSSLGHNVKLQQWDAGYFDKVGVTGSDKPAMTIKLDGANYVKPRQQRQPVANRNVATATGPFSLAAVNPNATTNPVTDTSSVSDALRTMQQSILSLQKMQEQTAQLHKQYLQGQEQAQQTIRQLLDQQQHLLTGQPLTAQPVAAAPIPETPNEVESAKQGDEDEQYQSVLLEVVSEKTGYPLEMLSLDMSLDTDLGIDSIKRVEILSALQERLPGIQKIQPEELGTFQLLQHIVEFLSTDAELPVADDATPAHSVATAGRFEQVLLDVVAEKTGYPESMLSLEMNLDTDLGIDSIKRVEILSAVQEKLPDAPSVSPEELGQLETLQQIVDYMSSGSATAPAPATAEPESKLLQSSLLDVVADKTGYPQEMLSLEMNLDTDLGIDSIKRVEILSALQERLPAMPAVSPEILAELQTLQQIIDYMSAESTAPALPLRQSDNKNSAADLLRQELLEVVADKTGYPQEMLDMGMNLDTDLGIDSIKRVEILSALQERLSDIPAVSPEALGELQTLQQIVDYLQADHGPAKPVGASTKRAEISTATPEVNKKLLRQIVQVTPVTRESGRDAIPFADNATILITDDGTQQAQHLCKALRERHLNARVIAMDADPDPEARGLIILAPDKADAGFVNDALQLMQKLSPSLRAAERNGATSLIAITRFGGRFGVEQVTGVSPIGAGIAGLIKTADKEWTNVNCKVIDIAGKISKASAGAIAGEIITAGPLEVGIDGRKRFTLTLGPDSFNELDGARVKPFTPDDVVVITGGARGVTAEIAVALAESCAPKLLLLGRSPLPAGEPEWLAGVESEADIKKAMLHNSGGFSSPKEMEDEYRRLLANREILSNLQRMRAAGAEVRYQMADVRDGEAVSTILEEARNTMGPIKGVIHGAGVLADRLIEDKTQEQFDEVFSTKVDGARCLLESAVSDELKLIVMFSSTTARLGRKGQADYAAANEVLNKLAQQQQRKHPDCRVLSINWGPWDGGMVTPQLRKLFAEEGVGVIPLQGGADYLIREMTTTGPVEIVVLGAPLHNRGDATMQLAFERTLSIENYPVLKSHVMNGKAVLPMALVAEWLAHGAMHNNPGLRFLGFDDLKIYKGVILENGERINLRIMAGPLQNEINHQHVAVELRSGDTLHAVAVIVLGTAYDPTPASTTAAINGEYPFKNSEYYGNGQLFHGRDLHGIEAVTAASNDGITACVKAAPPPSSWMAQPVRSAWLADPLVLDAAFQMMILWSFQQKEIGSLPTAIKQYRQYQRAFPKEGVKIAASVVHSNDHTTVASIEFIDHKDNLIAKIDGYECITDSSLNDAFTRNQLEEQA